MIAAIDEAVAMSFGMPPEVGVYLKGAALACEPGTINATIYVKSVGHRPIGFGAVETCEVKMLRCGPQSPPAR